MKWACQNDESYFERNVNYCLYIICFKILNTDNLINSYQSNFYLELIALEMQYSLFSETLHFG
jgi:hypothetical protein